MMNKIVITVGTLGDGGAERIASMLANRFYLDGVAVSIYTWLNTKPFYPLSDGITLHQIPEESGKTTPLCQMKWFRGKIREENPDIILSFLARFNIFTSCSLIGTSFPLVVAERSDPRFAGKKYHQFWGKLRDMAYMRANTVFAQTNIAKSYFPAFIQNKTTVIYNPIKMDEEYVGGALRWEKRKEIVTVARLMPVKDLPMLIRAFKLFYKTHPDYKLIIYGEGNERVGLENLIHQLGLIEVVLLPGRKKNIFEYLRGASIFAMSSLHEGMSNSLIEAMCMGLPCVSTRVTGALELIEDSSNGLLVNIKDEEGMAEALCKVADNPDFAFRLGTNASKLYERLQIEVIYKQWKEAIQSACDLEK